MAHGVLHLFPHRGGHRRSHLGQHSFFHLFAHLGLRALAHLLHHDLADALDDLLSHLLLHGGHDLFAHLGFRALLHLLGHDLPDALFHLGLHLFPRGRVDAVHHHLVGGLLHLARDLLLHGGAHLGGQLAIGLRVDIVHDLVQQLPLEAHHLFGVVVDGQLLQLDMELVKVLFLFLKGVVGSFQECLKHRLGGVHQGIAVAVDLVQALGQGVSAAGELLHAVHEVAAAGVKRIDALLQIACAVVQRACAVVQVGGARIQLFRAVRQAGRAVVQLLSAVHQRLCALRQAVRTVRQRAGTLRQLLRAVRQRAGALRQLARAVPQLARAVRQRVRAVVQLVHGVLQVLAQGIGIQVDLVLFPEDIGHIAGGEGVGAVRGIVHHVRLDGAGRGHIDMHLVVLGEVQRLGEARQAVADHAPQASRGDVLAVGHPDVGEVFLFHANDGDHDEGHRHRLTPAANDHLVLLEGLIADGDLQVAALSGQFFGRDGLPVQPVGEVHRDGQRRVGRALVGDLVAAGLPRDHVVGHAGKGLVAADVFYIFKSADVDDFILALVVVQPRADGDAVHIALGIGEDVDGLLLVLRQGGQHHPTEHGQCDDQGDAAHSISFHIFKPPFLRHVHSSCDVQRPLRRDVYRTQPHTEAHDALRHQRYPDHPDPRPHALKGKDDEEYSGDNGDQRQRQHQPPGAQAKAPGFHGGLDLEQVVRQQLHAQHQGKHVHGEAAAEYEHRPQRDGQHAQHGIVLERQTVGIPGIVTDDPDDAKCRDDRASAPADHIRCDVRQDQHRNAHDAEQGREDQIARLRRSYQLD